MGLWIALRRRNLVSLYYAGSYQMSSEYRRHDITTTVSVTFLFQERLFRNLKEPKHPRIYQLDPGGICWVPTGRLGLFIPLHDNKNNNVQLVSYRQRSSCDYTWPTDYKLYLTGTGIKAIARLKFAVVLLELQ